MRTEEETRTILIVDDDEMTRELLGQAFELKGGSLSDESWDVRNAENSLNYSHYWDNVGFEIVGTDDGNYGIKAIEENPERFSALLLDIEMPKMDGLDMLHILADRGIPLRIPIFLITGSDDYNSIKYAYDNGVMDVISKSVHPVLVWRRVTTVIELFEKRNKFEIEVKKKTRELEKRNRQLEDLNVGMIEALATATEFRSEESGEHVRRIRRLTELFLEDPEIGASYPEEEKHHIARASMLHDVGKIAVKDEILNKPGKLTREEFEEMKQHTVLGVKMLENIRQLKDLPFYDYAKTIAHYHHERWDGRGYPAQLAGDEIPLCAQIVSIADVYDALVSERVYKPAFSHEQALGMIREGKCGAFNPRLLECFSRISERIRDHYQHAVDTDDIMI